MARLEDLAFRMFEALAPARIYRLLPLRHSAGDSAGLSAEFSGVGSLRAAGSMPCYWNGDKETPVVVDAETLKQKLRGQLVETIEKGLAWLKDGTLSTAGAVTGR